MLTRRDFLKLAGAVGVATALSKLPDMVQAKPPPAPPGEADDLPESEDGWGVPWAIPWAIASDPPKPAKRRVFLPIIRKS